MNTPVSFEIARLLKEKEWKTPTVHYFFEDGVLIENSYRDTVGTDYGTDFTVELCQLKENWNDGWLTRKDGNRCFGCNKSRGYLETYSAPTISEVVMWLHEKHGIWINVIMEDDEIGIHFAFSITNNWNNEVSFVVRRSNHNSPTEAYSAAIEYTLKNLI